MCGLKAAQKHERPFRAAKDHMQPLAALDSFLLNRKMILNWHHLSSVLPTTRRWALMRKNFFSFAIKKYFTLSHDSKTYTFRNRKPVCFWCNYFYLHMIFINNSVLSKSKKVIKIPVTIIFRDHIDNTLGAVQKSYLSPGGGGLNQHVRMVWDRRGGVRDGLK